MKNAILSAAMQLANLKGFKRVSRADIAKRADVAAGSVSYHFGTMRGLRDAMVARAVESGNLRILAQAHAERHPLAVKAPEALRRAAAATLSG